MGRYEIIQKVKQELRKLKDVEHVEDLMNAKRTDELLQIVKELDFDEVHKFLNSNTLDMLEEDYDGYCMELAFYISVSGYSEGDFLRDIDEFIRKLSCVSELGEMIAGALDCFTLDEITIEQLVGN